MHMDREALNDYPPGLYGVTAEIITFEPDQQIAWTPHGQLDLGHVYGYRLEPIEEGTLGDVVPRLLGGRAGMEGRRHLPGNPSALRATPGILAALSPPPSPAPRPQPGDRGIPGYRPRASSTE